MLHASKKSTLEKAIDLLWNILDSAESGVFTSGFGIWKDRKETTEELSSNIKSEFKKNYERQN